MFRIEKEKENNLKCTAHLDKPADTYSLCRLCYCYCFSSCYFLALVFIQCSLFDFFVTMRKINRAVLSQVLCVNKYILSKNPEYLRCMHARRAL